MHPEHPGEHDDDDAPDNDEHDHVYVRRVDYDNLAKHVHDINVGAQRHLVHVLDSARRLINHVNDDSA
jgi:hypothetical protein